MVVCRTRERKDETTYKICYTPKKKSDENKKSDNNMDKKPKTPVRSKKKTEEATPPKRLVKLQASTGTPRRARIPEAKPPPSKTNRKQIDRLALQATGEVDLIGRDASANLDKIFSSLPQSDFALAASGQISLGEIKFKRQLTNKQKAAKKIRAKMKAEGGREQFFKNREEQSKRIKKQIKEKGIGSFPKVTQTKDGKITIDYPDSKKK
jgi:hypothetical protein